jgi:phage shock protein C
MGEGKKLYRDTDNKVILGVCSGIADYFNMDVTIVRLLAIIITCAGGSGVLVYIIAAIVIPEKPRSDAHDDKADKKA